MLCFIPLIQPLNLKYKYITTGAYEILSVQMCDGQLILFNNEIPLKNNVLFIIEAGSQIRK